MNYEDEVKAIQAGKPVKDRTNQENLKLEIRDCINKWSAENGSNTPDFILAEYLIDCLKAWDKNLMRREEWYQATPKDLTTRDNKEKE